jgi:hypothetical protein
MKLGASFAAAAFFAFTAGTAMAQTVIVTPEQETVIREYVRTQPVQKVDRPSNFELVVGAIVPDVFKPGELADNTVPDQKYQYVVIDGRTALIEPGTRKVVHIVE